MRTQFSFYIILIFLLRSGQIHAQSIFENYGLLTLNDGLGANNLAAVLEDDDGFIWIGSGNGLQIYDGNHFYTIPVGQGTKMMKGRSVRCLIKEDSFHIIAGTDEGLSQINTRTFKVENLTFSASDPLLAKTNFVQQIIKSRNGGFWVVTTMAVHRIHSDFKTVKTWMFPIESLAESKSIQPSRIMEFPNGRIWVVNSLTFDNGIKDDLRPFEISESDNEIKPVPDFKLENYAKDLSLFQINDTLSLIFYSDSLKNGIFGILNLNSNKYIKQKVRQFRMNTNIPFISLIEDGIVGITANEIFQYCIYNVKSNTWDYQSLNPYQLLKSFIKCKDYYFGATENGLLRTRSINYCFGDEYCFGLFKERKIIVTDVFEDSKQILISTFFDGLLRHIKSENDCSLLSMSNPANNENAIHGLIPLDTFNWLISGNGTWIYNDESKLSTSIGGRSNLNSVDSFTALVYKDAKGDIWFGSVYGYGISRYNFATNALRHYSLMEISKDAQFRSFDGIIEDHSGNLWFGSQEGTSLLKWIRKEDRFKIYYPNMEKELNFHPAISGFGIDTKGYIWMATEGYGIYRFHPDTMTFKNYNVTNGLPGDYLRSIVIDCQDKIWGICIEGLFRLDPITEQIYSFTISHGLPSTIIHKIKNISGQPCKYFISTVKGMRYLIPDNFSIPEPVPKIVIRSIKINNMELDNVTLSNFKLNYNENNFEIHFAHLNLLDGNLNKYYYRFENKDTNWIYFGNDQILRLNGLDHGHYIIELKVCQNGNVCFQTALFGFDIAVPYWESPWYYFILFLTGGSLIVGMISIEYRLRISRVEKQRDREVIRNKIAQDIHDEVGSSLTKIAMLAQLTSKLPNLDEHEIRDRLKKLGSDAKYASDQLREIIFSVNPDFDHFDDMRAYFKDQSRVFWEDTAMELEFYFPESKMNPIVHPDVKRQLLLIFKEIQNNIAKHANATKLQIKFLENPVSWYELEVRDNGIGINISRTSNFTKGISGMQNRAKSIKASFLFLSEKESGTSIKVSGPLILKGD